MTVVTTAACQATRAWTRNLLDEGASRDSDKTLTVGNTIKASNHSHSGSLATRPKWLRKSMATSASGPIKAVNKRGPSRRRLACVSNNDMEAFQTTQNGQDSLSYRPPVRSP